MRAFFLAIFSFTLEAGTDRIRVIARSNAPNSSGLFGSYLSGTFIAVDLASYASLAKIALTMYALLVILTLLSYSGQNQRKTDKNNTNTQTAAESAPTPTPSIPKTPSPQRENKSDGEQNATKPDPKPWLSHGEAVMAFLTTIYVVLTGIYVCISRSTLKAILRQEQDSSKQFAEQMIEVRKSAQAAKDSADATKGIVATLKEGSERQLRAYVVCEHGTIFNVANPVPVFLGQVFNPPSEAEITNPAFGPGYKIQIKNAGQTPAVEVRHWGNICFREFPLKSPLPARDPKIIPVASVLGPGIPSTKFNHLTQPLTAKETADLRAGTGAVYVYGEITYSDIWGKSWYTRYRLMHHAFGGAIGVSTDLSFCESGNEAT